MLHYYDALIRATARLNQVPVIFSEDFDDGRILKGVRFINGFDLFSFLKICFKPTMRVFDFSGLNIQ